MYKITSVPNYNPRYFTWISMNRMEMTLFCWFNAIELCVNSP